ncbi:hypothetical protein BS47DRAFT_1351995 [Hydnum rufescens UP504]|uniref:Glutaredoxin n=1 Tax=Hydnum rufescens UP504 TaxID=1448309 RepID=A0A9P6DR21_9AGAM|nr:hypothetical protein BS47DRAFT_1351995 [Hydnum rufescens UP504]
MATNLYDVTSTDQFKELLSQDLTRVSVLNFWAEIAEASKTINALLKELAVKYPDPLFLFIEAEVQEDIAESFEIEVAPTLVILRGHTLLQRIQGADQKALIASLETYGRKGPVALSTTTKSPAAPPTHVDFGEKPSKKRLVGLMNMDKAVLFMKGTPDKPECGFSRKFVAKLREQNVPFSYFNIYTDESVRQGMMISQFFPCLCSNDWPTFPQFIVNGEFIGGLDIVTEMIEEGEFEDVVASVRA